jgi:hypothetical protein
MSSDDIRKLESLTSLAGGSISYLEFKEILTEWMSEVNNVLKPILADCDCELLDHCDYCSDQEEIE